MHIARLLIFSIFYILCSLFNISVAHASESALSASPAILETVLESSRPTLTTITIQNNTSFPLPIKGSASSFLATQYIPTDRLETYDASHWFTLNPADFILQPNEVKKIEVTITPPLDAEPSGHYATLYFRPLIPQDAVSASSAISLARIGVLAMMIVPGDIKTALSINSLTAPAWQSFGPLTFTSKLSNQGTIHLLPQNTLTIKNIWGQTVKELKSDPSIILPHTTKDYSFHWSQKLGMGPYTATLETTYGTDQSPLISDVLTIWLIPWPVMLVVICTLTLLYKIFIVNRKRLSLAIAVLKGTYEPPETTQKSPLIRPRPRRRTHSLHSPRTTQRSSRR